MLEFWVELWPAVAAMAIVLVVIPVLGLYMTFLERKVAAAVQDRVGPNRVGPGGWLQAVADGVKIFLKEQVVPDHVNKAIYFLAPTIGMATALFAVAVVPFGPVSTDPSTGGFRFIVAPGVDIGLVFLFAVSSLSAYGVILGGWASNNKYSLYGAIRSCAQFLSYEIPLGLSVLGVVAAAGSLNIETIVHDQDGGIFHWNVFWQPLAAVLFFVAALAETNRLPFDLSECEQELVGGFHTEYSGIKFVLFFLGEYTHVVTVSFLTVLLFFGGWNFPGVATVDNATLWGTSLLLFVLLAKVALVVFFILILRWTLPRFRFDQLMGLAWKGMIPLGMLNLVGVMIVLSLGSPRIWLTAASLGLFVAAGALNVRQWQRSTISRRSRSPLSLAEGAA